MGLITLQQCEAHGWICDCFHLQAASKYSLAKAPKLVDIISAVPEEQRAVLLPRSVSSCDFSDRNPCQNRTGGKA